MHNKLAAVLLGLAVVSAPSAQGEGNAADVTDMQALRAAVRADKRAFVAQTMQLTEVEAKRFWPIYEQYQRDLDMSNRMNTRALEGFVTRDRPMTTPYLKALGNDLITADEIEVRARRKLYSGLIKALPPNKAARYLQLEAKVRAFQDYDIATTFPLVK